MVVKKNKNGPKRGARTPMSQARREAAIERELELEIQKTVARELEENTEAYRPMMDSIFDQVVKVTPEGVAVDLEITMRSMADSFIKTQILEEMEHSLADLAERIKMRRISAELMVNTVMTGWKEYLDKRIGKKVGEVSATNTDERIEGYE